MISWFEKNGHLGIQSCRWHKTVPSDVVEVVTNGIFEKSMDDVVDSSRTMTFGCSLEHIVKRTEKNGALFPVQNQS